MNTYVLEGKKLEIKTYPDPVLTTVASPVTVFDEELKNLCKNMLYTMYMAPGIGLAAPQVGISKRLFVIDVDYEREETEEGSGEYVYSNFNPQIFINPVFKIKEGETTYQEGCLSLPGIYEEVKRAKKVTVSFQDLDGNFHELEADELFSICLQHENDHLDGIVFLERLSQLKRKFLKNKLIKEKAKNNS